MRQASLMFVTMFMTACSSQSQSCSYFHMPTGGWATATPQEGAAQTEALPAPADHGASEHDTVALVATESGMFAVASVGPAAEVRVYRVDAGELDEDPLVVRLAGAVHVDGEPGRVTCDDHGHALVAIGDDVVTLDPLTLTVIGDRVRATPAPIDAIATLDDAFAYASDGDAWLNDERVGGPGITRAVAFGDVHGESATRRVLVMQTVEPRMLVFFTTKDLTMPAAFEPLN